MFAFLGSLFLYPDFPNKFSPLLSPAWCCFSLLFTSQTHECLEEQALSLHEKYSSSSFPPFWRKGLLSLASLVCCLEASDAGSFIPRSKRTNGYENEMKGERRNHASHELFVCPDLFFYLYFFTSHSILLFGDACRSNSSTVSWLFVWFWFLPLSSTRWCLRNLFDPWKWKNLHPRKYCPVHRSRETIRLQIFRCPLSLTLTNSLTRSLTQLIYLPLAGISLSLTASFPTIYLSRFF